VDRRFHSLTAKLLGKRRVSKREESVGVKGRSEMEGGVGIGEE
jgi:hypothetical protein